MNPALFQFRLQKIWMF